MPKPARWRKSCCEGHLALAQNRTARRPRQVPPKRRSGPEMLLLADLGGRGFREPRSRIAASESDIIWANLD